MTPEQNSPRKAVVMTAWRRPSYTSTSLDALFKCRGIEDYDVLVQIDGGSDTQSLIYDEIVSLSFDVFLRSKSLVVKKIDANLGVARAPLEALRWGFEDHDFVVKIEDDAVLTPDALEVANFYCNVSEKDRHFAERWTLMSLCAHADKGSHGPRFIREWDHITAPFAFCLHRQHWPFVERVWNCKKVPPIGWDWSLTYAMRLEKRRTVAPMLSRCANIGRDGGVHDTHETFDAMQVGVTHSSGVRTWYFVVSPTLPNSALETLDPWMEEEFKHGTRP